MILTLSEPTSLEVKLKNLEDKMARLKIALGKAEKEIYEKKLDEASISNEEKVNFYAGLPTWQVFCILLDHIKPDLLEHSALGSHGGNVPQNDV